MNIRKSIQNLAEKAINLILPNGQRVHPRDYFGFSFFGNSVDFQTTPKTVAEGYGYNPYLFTVVDKIASIAAELPRELIDKNTGKVVKRQDSEAKAFLELMKNPNSYESRYEFYYRVIANTLLGNSYIYGLTPIGFDEETLGFTMPTQLICPISTDVVINENTTTLDEITFSFSFYNKNFNNKTTDQVLHIKRPNIIVDTRYGLSTLTPASALYQTSNEIFKSGYNLHKNKGIQGIIHHKGSHQILSPKEQEEIQRRYDNQYGGNDNMSRVAVSSRELGYIAMGVNPNDLKSIESNLELKRDTAAMFKIASILIGDTAASTYSNMEEAEKAAYRDSYLPIARIIDRDLSNWLLKGKPYCWKVNEKAIPILQDDKTELINNTIKLYKAGLITTQEGRERIDSDMKNVPEELRQNQTQENNVTNENEQENEN